MTSASASGQAFRTAQGSRSIGLSKSVGSDKSDITVFRISDGKFAVQERSVNGELKRSHVAVNSRDALCVRDNWKKEGIQRNMSYTNDDARSSRNPQMPSRTHQSEDGDVLIRTTRGRDHQGKESYLIQKTNTKTGKIERTTASSATEATQKHDRFLQDEYQTGKKFREIKV
jgi:hypothetical protein